MHTESEMLVQKVKNGDSKAFSALMGIYQRPIYNLCYRMLGNASEAEDAAQETFLRVYRSINGYDSSKRFATWILSIAAHYCIDLTRKHRIDTLPLDETPQLRILDKPGGIEDRIIRKEEKEKVNILLQKLKPLDRTIVIMYYWNDMSYSEISEALNLSLNAIKSRLHRARRAMAKSWMAMKFDKELIVDGVQL